VPIGLIASPDCRSESKGDACRKQPSHAGGWALARPGQAGRIGINHLQIRQL